MFSSARLTANFDALPPYHEAVIALETKSGKVKWVFRPRKHDTCDFDFGATPNVINLGTNRYVGIGGKDGTYYLLHRLTDNPQGQVAWAKNVVFGGAGRGLLRSCSLRWSTHLQCDRNRGFKRHFRWIASRTTLLSRELLRRGESAPFKFRRSDDMNLTARIAVFAGVVFQQWSSTEEDSNQEFNSLDAQREASEAFILSQRREGWIAL